MVKLYKNSPWWWYLIVTGGVSLLFLFGFLPSEEIDPLVKYIMRGLLLLIFCIHIAEALYARQLANKHGMGEVANKWFWHTMLCGFMALLILKKIIKHKEGGI